MGPTTIVGGYSFDMEHPYGAGQRRGVLVANTGSVRALLPGKVVYSGAVAGRSVMVIRSDWHGKPLRVSYIGLQEQLSLGVVVEAGARVGSADGMIHIGARKDGQRHGYVPIERSMMLAPPIRHREPEMADRVKGSGLDAILARIVLGAATQSRSSGPTMQPSRLEFASESLAQKGRSHHPILLSDHTRSREGWLDKNGERHLGIPVATSKLKASRSTSNTVQRVASAKGQPWSSSLFGVTRFVDHAIGAVTTTSELSAADWPRRENRDATSPSAARTLSDLADRTEFGLISERVDSLGATPTAVTSEAVVSEVATVDQSRRSEASRRPWYKNYLGRVDNRRAPRVVLIFSIALCAMLFARHVLKRWFGTLGRRRGSAQLVGKVGLARGADLSLHELLEVAGLAAEDALIDWLRKDDSLTLYKDLERISIANLHPLADFDGDNNPPELIDLSDDACIFHKNLSIRE